MKQSKTEIKNEMKNSPSQMQNSTENLIYYLKDKVIKSL